MRSFVFVLALALAAFAAAQESVDSYSQAAIDVQNQQVNIENHPLDHALAPPPADHVSPLARHILIASPEQEDQPELARAKRQGFYPGYGRRGYGRRHRYGGYGGYPGGYGGYGGYPGGYGGYGGYPGGFGGGYPGGFGGGLGGSSASANAQSSSFNIGGGFGPFQGSISSSSANANSGSFGFGR
ncbi:uncharacterized protein LOC132200048 isoform X1 [Neocloeon triangulifer]|uniref:uncharacterized protein LOC132200048 isoform X1 n=1 Tax=Neocloeon triangulifer TaxID=2078957 RepID=UPI00286F2F7A|nr:uncharacterized protein LOC132200048 isoform X1 [Neocloeon triangulifer]